MSSSCNNYFKSFFFIAIGIFLINHSAHAQHKNLIHDTESEIRFVNYLVSSNQNAEALHLIGKYEKMDLFHSFTDSLYFLKGKVFYNQHKLLESARAFAHISQAFSLNAPLSILSAYEYVHLNEIDQAKQILGSINTKDSLTKELILFQQASIDILQRNVAGYDNYLNKQDTSYNELFEAQMKLNNYAYMLKEHKQKSPLVAGIMSAIIPGSGKMYTGKIGEGVSTLLGMGVLGAITYENYKKAGISNYKTITFASLFSVLYAGNIFGSVYSVKVYRTEFNNSLEHAVLFNMHIPIRTVFPSIFE